MTIQQQTKLAQQNRAKLQTPAAQQQRAAHVADLAARLAKAWRTTTCGLSLSDRGAK